MNYKEITDSIQNCMNFQQGLNIKFDPDWKKAGNNYRRAMWVESAELVSLIGYKNSYSVYDKKDVLKKLSSILQYLLSDCIVNRVSPETLHNTYIWATKHTYADTKEKQIRLVEEFVVSLLDSETTSYIAQYFSILCAVDGDIESVLKYYVGNNALKMFRVDNGFLSGVYNTIWEYGDIIAEDTIYLESVLNDIDSQIVVNDVYNQLSAIYNNRVIKNNETI